MLLIIPDNQEELYCPHFNILTVKLFNYKIEEYFNKFFVHVIKILSKQRTSQIYKGFKHCNAHLHIYSHLKFKKYKQLTESHITNEEPEA